MPETPHNGMNCAEFQAVLAEAVEGSLDAGRMGEVRAHVGSCETCGPLFAEALAGHEWAHSLGEVEPPAGLLSSILGATSRAEVPVARESKAAATASGMAVALAGAKRPSKAPRWGGQWLPPFMAPVLHARVMATAAMAFFSIALLLNLAGVHITNFRAADLRPSALRAGMSRQYYQTTARVTKYYDSVRFVYELQSRVQELKNAAIPQPEQERPRKREKDKRDISNRPGEQNNQRYSRQELNSAPTLAEFHPIAMAVQPARRGLMYRSRRQA